MSFHVLKIAIIMLFSRHVLAKFFRQDLQEKQEKFLDKIDKINGIGGRET